MEGCRRSFAGDWVQVRPFNEVVNTLDQEGRLDYLPFMPEMKQHCGKQFQVKRRVEKACVESHGVRALTGTVVLAGLYCDGTAHDDCQKGCPLLWKESWLQPSDCAPASAVEPLPSAKPVALRTKWDSVHYCCQSSELVKASVPLARFGVGKITSEVTTGNVSVCEGLRLLMLPFWRKVGSGLLGRSAVPVRGQRVKTPTEALSLQPGERVVVKSPLEITTTLDRNGRNRGLAFTHTMLPFCGREFIVRCRVQRMISETTGEMRALENTVLLEGVTCDGSAVFGGCPRSVHHLWREIWLQRSPKVEAIPAGA